MDKVFDWGQLILTAAINMLERILAYLPQLVGAFAILIFGWVVARLVKALATKIAQSVDRLTDSLRTSASPSTKLINPALVQITSNVIFWLVILFFVTSAANLLGLTMFAGWLGRVIGHLPNILSGALIIFAGVVFGNLMGDAVRAGSGAMPDRQRDLLAQGAQIFTVTTMIVIGIDQIGIDITVLITVLAIAVGALLGGLALAFSLGSRTLVSNLIGAHYLNRDYRIGETIRVGSNSGVILEISHIAVVIETNEGRMTIPAKTFGEETTLLVHQEKVNA
mgnify:CR=1 FL=1